jgi:hypothetical protein
MSVRHEAHGLLLDAEDSFRLMPADGNGTTSSKFTAGKSSPDRDQSIARIRKPWLLAMRNHSRRLTNPERQSVHA